MKRDRLPSPGQPAYKTYRWVIVIMLWLICVFNYADRQAIASVDKYLIAEFHFDDAQLGLIKSAFMWVYALSAPFAGQFGDVFARKWIIIAGLYIWSTVTGFTALCGKLWQFVFVRGAEGLGETFYFPASMSLVSDYHATSTRSRAMGLHQTGTYVGTIAGGAFAGWLAMYYDNWRHPFIILGGAGIVLGVVLMAFIREPRRNEAQQFETPDETPPGPLPMVPMGRFLLEWMRTPSALLLLLAFPLANVVSTEFMMWTPTFLGRKFGMNAAQAGLYGTLFVRGGCAVGSVAGGFLADYLRRRMAGGRMLAQFAGIVIGAPLIYLFGATQSVGFLFVVMAVYGISEGMYDSGIWASLFDVIPPARRAAAVGLMNMFAWGAGGIGVWLMGVYIDLYVAAHAHGSTAEPLLHELRVQAMSDGFEYLTLIALVTGTMLALASLRYAKRDVARAAAMAQ